MAKGTASFSSMGKSSQYIVEKLGADKPTEAKTEKQEDIKQEAKTTKRQGRPSIYEGQELEKVVINIPADTVEKARELINYDDSISSMPQLIYTLIEREYKKNEEIIKAIKKMKGGK